MTSPSNQQGQKNKIAFFLSSFRAGGGEKQMVLIANTFVGQGYRVDLLVLKPVGDLAGSVDSRVRVISLDAGKVLFSFPNLVSYLRRERPRAILSLDEYTHAMALVAKLFVRVRVVLRIGNMLSVLAEHYEGKAKVLPFITRPLFKRADAVIANSHGVADDFIAVSGIEASRVTVIHNPKSCEEILTKAEEPVEYDWLAHKTQPVIIAVGRLRTQKNYPLLIRAFAKLVRDIPSRLIIVGQGREKDRLQALIKSLGCDDSVALVGYADNPYAWMKKADIYAASSLWEGLPNALLEAMVCGVPVIAADCASGPREILAPDTDYRKRLSVGEGVEYAHYGALYAVNDESALEEALKKYLTDHEMAKKYGAVSVDRSKDFDAYGIVKEYARVLGV